MALKEHESVCAIFVMHIGEFYKGWFENIYWPNQRIIFEISHAGNQVWFKEFHKTLKINFHYKPAFDNGHHAQKFHEMDLLDVLSNSIVVMESQNLAWGPLS